MDNLRRRGENCAAVFPLLTERFWFYLAAVKKLVVAAFAGGAKRKWIHWHKVEPISY